MRVEATCACYARVVVVVVVVEEEEEEEEERGGKWKLESIRKPICSSPLYFPC
jgi:hypothetical protein